MNVVQFEISGEGRRVGVVDSGLVVDVTSSNPELQYVVDVFAAAQRAGRSFDEFLGEAAAKDSLQSFDLDQLLAARPGGWGGAVSASAAGSCGSASSVGVGDRADAYRWDEVAGSDAQ